MANPIDSIVGKKLRLQRSVLGLSQQDLGKAAGITFQQVQKYERGLNRISSSRLYQFASVLNVPVAYFFEDMENAVRSATDPQADSDKIMTRETQDLIRHYYKIKNPVLRKRIADLIKEVADH